MLSILSFIFVLGVLVFIHELGHFLVAKKVGIRVDRFSLGFPPNVLARKWGETTYCIGLIPLGGYVKMAGENPDEEATGSPHEFMSKSAGRRAAVILAGPFMNYLLSIFILAGILFIFGQPLFDPERALVGEVIKGHPAFQAGLKPGDQILAIDGEPVSGFEAMRVRINAHVAEPIELTWLHEGDTITTVVITAIAEQPDLQGGLDSVGIIGIVEKVIGYEKFGILASLGNGFATTNTIAIATVKFVKKAITGEVSAKLIGGPLFIAQQSGKEARKGASSLFFFMALLSVNLAILNVLPIPILDGGQLLFLVIEKIRGSPLSMKARVVAQQAGLVVILGLVLMVTYNDIIRVLRGF